LIIFASAAPPKGEKPNGEKRSKDSAPRAAAAEPEPSKKEITGSTREGGGHGRKQVRENKGRSGKGKNGVTQVRIDKVIDQHFK